jgi:hypothetical protein
MKRYKAPTPPGRGRPSGPVVSREAVLRIIGRRSVMRSDNPLRDLRALVLQLPSAHRTIFNPRPNHLTRCGQCDGEDGPAVARVRIRDCDGTTFDDDVCRQCRIDFKEDTVKVIAKYPKEAR